MPEKNRTRRFWEVDPAIFKPGPKTSLPRRFLIEPLKRGAKLILYALIFAYPVYLPILGIMFGGLVFWGTFAGSAGLIGLLLWKAGLSKNYSAWSLSLRRQLGGVSLGFLLAVGFFLGLEYLKTWMLLVVFGLVALGLILLLRSKLS